MEEFQECSRRSCRWAGKPDDMERRPNEDGFSYTLVCPSCGGHEFYKEKPLFIPLKAEYFHAFKEGTKPNSEEYRPYGPRWNEGTCRIGRRVTLSLGYGKKHRLHGRIVAFRTATGQHLPGWVEVYGDRFVKAACIKIELEGGAA